MLGLEYAGFALLIAKYFLLLVIGLKMYNILSEMLTGLTDETMGNNMAFMVSLVFIFLIREMFIIMLVLAAVALYVFGWFGTFMGFLKAVK